MPRVCTRLWFTPRVMYLAMTGCHENAKEWKCQEEGARWNLSVFTVHRARYSKFVDISVVWWSRWIAFEAFSNALASRHRNPWGSSCWSHCADTTGSPKLARFRKFLISHRSLFSKINRIWITALFFRLSNFIQLYSCLLMETCLINF